MIKRIFFENFMGRTESVAVGEGVNLFSGPNGSGKTTIRKALLLALGQSTGDGKAVCKDARAVYDFYCGEDCGEMIVGIETDAGELVRSYVKKESKSGALSVNCSVKYCDKKLQVQNTDFQDLTGCRVFDPVAFLASTPADRTAKLCELCDSVTPEQLEALDKDLDKFTDKKNELDRSLKEKRHALEDTQKDLKAQETEEGVDYSGIPAKIEQMLKQRDDIHRQVTDATLTATRVNKAKEDVQKKTDRLIELQEKAVVEPSGDPLPLEEMDRQLAEHDKAKLLVEEMEALEKEVEKLEGELYAPAPPEVSEAQLQEMKSEIEALQTESLDISVDKAVYEAFIALWKDLRPVLDEKGIVTEISPLFQATVNPYKARIDKAQRSEHNANRKEELSLAISNAETARVAYSSLKNAYDRSLMDLSVKRNALLSVEPTQYDKPAHERLKTDRLKRNLDNEAIERDRQLAQEHTAMIERLTNELTETADIAKQAIPEIDTLVEQGGELTRQINHLNGLVQQAANYKAVADLADRQKTELANISDELDCAKNALYYAQQKKLDLLNSLVEVIEKRSEGVVSPYSIQLDIKGGRSGYVRFILVKPNGQRVPLEVACGGEKVQVFAALTVALLGQTGGIVLSECVELDVPNTERLISRLKDIGGVQSFLYGHSLDDFPGTTFVSCGGK